MCGAEVCMVDDQKIKLGIILSSVFFRMSVFLETDCPFLMSHNLNGTTCSSRTINRFYTYSWQSWDWETQTCVLCFTEQM